ncbi:MAG: type I pullulanase [Bacillota bacterium]|nr:type I pullulanase [Bacillota bacterium]
MNSSERPFFAYLDEMNSITILLPLSYHNGSSSVFYFEDGYAEKLLECKEKFQIDEYMKYICAVPFDFPFGKTIWIKDEHGERTDIQMGAVIRTPQFDDTFFYDGNDLGVAYTKERTDLKLWAPTATQVKIKLQAPESPFFEIIKMKRGEKGIWTASVNRDVDLYKYSYLVCINLEWREAVDPYTVSVTPDGEWGVIVDMEKTKHENDPLPAFEHPVDAIIYETHIRDFTIHPNSGVKNKGTYLGASEMNTKTPNGSLTGLAHVKELGITHIEFLPFHDFAGVDEYVPEKDYNWGYNPLHFNAPEGSYSSSPSNPYSRINELKQCIQQIHREGIRVIMDAVYNHVYIRETSPFEKIVPGYYFRHNEHGMPSNGTGVGNDLASERLMMRKYILDSIRFWLEEYHLDGFRFDLMGILDVQTMQAVRELCDSYALDILIIGEGWDLNTPLSTERKATIRNQGALHGIGQFNDLFRDSIKGSTFNLYDKGFALGNEHFYEAAKEVVGGSIGLKKRENGLFDEPAQSVNYVESHDNHTLWDKLIFCFQEQEDKKKRDYHQLATSLVILSQGIPFLHSGQEFFRSKNGVGNSYRSPDEVNRLDWDSKALHEEYVQYIKGLISIRKYFACFRMRTADEIRRHMVQIELPFPLLGFHYQQVNDSSEWSEVLLYINSTSSHREIVLPHGEWALFADRERAGSIPVLKNISGTTTIHERSIIILAKK